MAARRYTANLKRELPRIPYAPRFRMMTEAGKILCRLHVDYEEQKEYPLERREKPGDKLALRVEKMLLTQLIPFATLGRSGQAAAARMETLTRFRLRPVFLRSLRYTARGPAARGRILFD